MTVSNSDKNQPIRLSSYENAVIARLFGEPRAVGEGCDLFGNAVGRTYRLEGLGQDSLQYLRTAVGTGFPVYRTGDIRVQAGFTALKLCVTERPQGLVEGAAAVDEALARLGATQAAAGPGAGDRASCPEVSARPPSVGSVTTAPSTTTSRWEAQRSFDAARVHLHPLTPFSAIIVEASRRGLFAESDLALLEAWMRDPHGWISTTDQA